MATYKYRPYYQFNGPSHSEPMREELPTKDIEQRLALFFSEIGTYFDDDTAQIEPTPDGIICVTTNLTSSHCDDQVKRCLNTLDLYARKIPNDF